MATAKPNFTIVGDEPNGSHKSAFDKLQEELEAKARKAEEHLYKKSTALIRVDTMAPLDALSQHIRVKEGGRGAIHNFVENETIYPEYGHYYYQLKKLGIAPFRKSGVATEAPKMPYEPTLEEQVQELKRQLAMAKVSPAKRAVDVLYGQFDRLGSRSRSFLCTIIAYDRAHLTAKQEKWLKDLEDKNL
jgi:hypothetical protein